MRLSKATHPVLALLTFSGLLASTPPRAEAQTLVLNNSATATIGGGGTTTTGSPVFGAGGNNATTAFSFVNTYDTSSLTVAAGGSVTSLSSNGSSTVNVTGGTVGNLTAGGAGPNNLPSAGPITISGGNVTNLIANTTGPVTISGGNVGTASEGPGAFSITGGSVFQLTGNGGAVSITGGSLSLFSAGSSSFYAFGSNLAITPIIPSSSPFLAGTYLVTGTLTDGEMLDTRYSGFLSKIFLNNSNTPAVPEASTTVSFGLLLALGLGGLVIAARRKKAQSAL